MKDITEISNKELIAEIGKRMMNEYKNECKTNKQKYDTAKTHIICQIEIGEETINPLLYCKEFKQKTERTEKYTVICSECVNALKAENAKLTAQQDTITFPLELQYGDLTNYISYGQAETEKLVAISFGKLTEKGKYAGENMTKDKASVPLFIAYFDKIESLEVLENLINIAKARLKELEAQNERD